MNSKGILVCQLIWCIWIIYFHVFFLVPFSSQEHAFFFFFFVHLKKNNSVLNWKKSDLNSPSLTHRPRLYGLNDKLWDLSDTMGNMQDLRTKIPTLHNSFYHCVGTSSLISVNYSLNCIPTKLRKPWLITSWTSKFAYCND